MQDLLLAVDIGTSAVKVGLFDLRAKLLASASASHEVSAPQAMWLEMATEVWWRGFLASLSTLRKQFEFNPEQIRGIGTSVLFPALIPLDGGGQPLRPAILYCDQRSLPQSKWLEDRIGLDRFARVTGNAVPPGTCSLTSMLWVREHEPDVYAKTKHFVHTNGYFTCRLTGRSTMDWTNASLSGLFQTGGPLAWDETLADDVGLAPEKLPPAVSPDALVGEVTRDIAAETGLAEGTPVAAGAGDTVCSALGASVIEAEQLLVTCGTTDNLTACIAKPVFDRRFVACCHAAPDRWTLIGTMSNTGAAVEWFRKSIAPDLAGEGTGSPYEVLSRWVEEAGQGAHGLLFLPYLHGERSPHWDPLARGVFFGLRPSSDRRHLARALFEGVAFALRENIEVLEELQGGETTEILLAGGASRNAVWNQIKADVTGKPILTSDFAETSLRGAALLAGLAAGVYSSPQEAAQVAIDRDDRRVTQPRAELYESYSDLFRLYQNLYGSLRGRFEELAGLRGNLKAGL